MDNEIMEMMKSLMKEMSNGFEKVNKRLDKIETDVKGLKEGQEELKADVKELKEKIDNVYNQTADLTEFKTEVNTKLDVLNDNISNIEIVTANNWADIARLKKAK